MKSISFVNIYFISLDKKYLDTSSDTVGLREKMLQSQIIIQSIYFVNDLNGINRFL